MVAGATSNLADPAAVEIIRIATAAQLADEIGKRAPETDVVIMAAAVADFRPVQVSDAKIKKSASGPPPIELTTNPDILASLVAARRRGSVPQSTAIVGFAAETGDRQHGVLDHGRAKVARKGCDLLVVNAVGEGKAFGMDHNTGWILAAGGEETALPLGSKTLMATRILDAINAVRADSVGAEDRCP
jgi:phosphopantothenoylcysteine decarboxylase/phosphopantothenate--cysteine ligase